VDRLEAILGEIFSDPSDWRVPQAMTPFDSSVAQPEVLNQFVSHIPGFEGEGLILITAHPLNQRRAISIVADGEGASSASVPTGPNASKVPSSPDEALAEGSKGKRKASATRADRPTTKRTKSSVRRSCGSLDLGRKRYSSGSTGTRPC